MPVIIHTGDEQKCRVVHLMECPACHQSFETAEGVYQPSATLGEKVLVCAKHTILTGVDEVHIQTSLRKALDHKRGHVMKAGKLVKKSQLLEKIDNKKLETVIDGG